MTDIIYPSDTVSRTLTFTDEDDALFDPDTITVDVINPSGVTVETQTKTDLTPVSLGVFDFLYTLASDAPTGRWRIEVTATEGTESNTEIFWWEVEAATAYRYGDLETVKNLVAVELTELAFDTQIDLAIRTADNLINVALERCGATIPLTSPESIIRDASNYLAAGLYKQKDVPDEKVHSFYTVGLNLINEYIATHYPGEPLLPTTPESTSSSVSTLAYGVGTAT